MCGCLSCAPMGTQPTTQVCALTRNRTGNPLVQVPVLNPLSHTSQGEIHIFLNKEVCIAMKIIYKQLNLCFKV